MRTFPSLYWSDCGGCGADKTLIRTVAVSCPNGYVQSIARVEEDEAYRKNDASIVSPFITTFAVCILYS